MIMKRFSDGDGLAGYAEVVRYYVELTGQGMRDHAGSPTPRNGEERPRCNENGGKVGR